MAVYTVHQPPLREGETAPNTDRFVFVRDGFYFWAFLFGPVWVIWRRLWLVLVLYVVALIAIGMAMRHVEANSWVQSLVTFTMMILVGLEAGTLRRWTLARRGWKNVGVVVGDDLEAAERRFFADWMERGASRARPAAAKPQVAAGIRAPTTSGPDVLGLFPEADKPR